MSRTAVLGWLRTLLESPTAERQPALTPRYTADEVRAALRQVPTEQRARQIHESVARLGARLDEGAVRRRFRGIEDYHQRLLRILTLYGRGWEPARIAAELSPFSTAVGVEYAIEAAALVVAEELNQRRAA